jgi:hypothetical protein
MSFFSKIFGSNAPASPPIPSRHDEIRKEYPYSMYMHWHSVGFAFQTVVMSHNLQEHKDYVLMVGGREEVLIKDQNIFHEIQKIAAKETKLDNVFSSYKDIVDSVYEQEIFKHENDLTTWITFIPKEDKIYEVISKVVQFYVKNNYKMPNATMFRNSMFMADKNKRKFYVRIRDKTEGAQLLLELGDIVDVIEE